MSPTVSDTALHPYPRLDIPWPRHHVHRAYCVAVSFAKHSSLSTTSVFAHFCHIDETVLCIKLNLIDLKNHYSCQAS